MSDLEKDISEQDIEAAQRMFGIVREDTPGQLPDSWQAMEVRDHDDGLGPLSQEWQEMLNAPSSKNGRSL